MISQEAVRQLVVCNGCGNPISAHSVVDGRIVHPGRGADTKGREGFDDFHLPSRRTDIEPEKGEATARPMSSAPTQRRRRP